MNNLRHWWIQKPVDSNRPLETRGAVFEEFAPTVREQGCEWIKVFSAGDFHLKANMGITRWSEVSIENHSLKARIAQLEEMLEEARRLFRNEYGLHGSVKRKLEWLAKIEALRGVK
jgi:hypothetical protein